MVWCRLVCVQYFLVFFLIQIDFWTTVYSRRQITVQHIHRHLILVLIFFRSVWSAYRYSSVCVSMFFFFFWNRKRNSILIVVIRRFCYHCWILYYSYASIIFFFLLSFFLYFFPCSFINKLLLLNTHQVANK